MPLLAGLATSFGGKALLSGLSSIGNWLTGGSSITSQMNAQKHLMDHQFQLNQQQWAAENEYNSPLSQMTRLKSAGLNPNLVYGSGGVTGNTTTQGPRASIPHVDRNQLKFENLANIIDRIENIKAIRSNSSAQDALAELYGQKAATEKLTRSAMELDIIKKQFDNYITSQTYSNSIEGSKLGLEEQRKRLEKLGKELGLYDKQIEKLGAEIGLIGANKANVEERTTTQRHQNEYWWSKGLNPNANPALTALANLPDLLKDGYDKGNVFGLNWDDIPEFEKSRVEGMYSRASRNSRELFGKEMSLVRRLFLSMLAAMEDASNSHQFIGR